MPLSENQIKSLEAPLGKSVVKERKQGGATVSYVEAWHAIAEANRIFGFDGWTRETVLMQETNRDLVDLRGDRGPYKQWRVGYLAKVRINVGGVIREGTGFGSGMAKPEALGEAIESAAKEAESDAMKRAFMTFGNPFGLALYDKERANVVNDMEPPAKPEKPAQQRKEDAKAPAVKPTLKDRAERLKGALRASKTQDELRKTYELGSGLCAELDEKDPETLFDVEVLYKEIFDKLDPFYLEGDAVPAFD